MSLRHGRPMVSIPGPSVIPDRVLNAMHRPMPNIYEGDLIDLSFSVLDDLPKVARTSQPVFVSVSNGHGAWEMAITNTLSRGDTVLVLESGRFAVSWGEMAAICGVDVEVLPGTDVSESWNGLGIEIHRGSQGVDFSARVGVYQGQPMVTVRDGRESDDNAPVRKKLARGLMKDGGPQELELRVVPDGAEDARQLTESLVRGVLEFCQDNCEDDMTMVTVRRAD